MENKGQWTTRPMAMTVQEFWKSLVLGQNWPFDPRGAWARVFPKAAYT